jgi:hypothetical protein
MQESRTDMLSKDCTTNRSWCREHSDRLLAWEMLRRTVMHETRVPMTNEELCDTIGVSSSHTIRLLNNIQDRLNEE